MAKSRKLSKNRLLLELVENGIEAEKRKQQQFLALAERFRNEPDPEAANRLGDELGRMVFGADAASRTLGQLTWVETRPETPEGDWYKDFGSFKICGSGSYPKTFLLRGQPAKGEAL